MAVHQTQVLRVPAEILAVEFRIVDGHVLHLPERILRRNLGIMNFHILYVLEYIFAVTFQSVHINVVAEHERISAPMQFEVLDADVVATPEYLVGIVHRYVLDVYFVHLAEHLRRINNRVGHFQVVTIPQGRAASNIEITMVDFEAVYMPERIITLETAFERFDVAALFDGRFSGTDNHILQTEVMGFEQGTFAPELSIFNKFHLRYCFSYYWFQKLRSHCLAREQKPALTDHRAALNECSCKTKRTFHRKGRDNWNRRASNPRSGLSPAGYCL